MTVGSSPVDRSKLGQAKRHILTDKQGIPLSAVISSASTHDIKAVTKMLLIIQLSKENLHHISQRKRGQIIIIIYALIERTTLKE
jgi:IS5 family transposase